MNVVFIVADKPREHTLALAFGCGVVRHGDTCNIVQKTGGHVEADCDVAVMVGVKCLKLFRAYQAAGKQIVYLDKGYLRNSKYWRVALNAHQPTGYLMSMNKPDDRWRSLGLTVEEWKHGKRILMAGSSAKYNAFYGLDDPDTYYRNLYEDIRRYSDRPIIYRPKPSYQNARPIEGASFSSGRLPIEKDLENCHVLVTHGSNACVEALLAGVPSIILGDGVTKPISDTFLEHIGHPLCVAREQRMDLLANLAYCQWTEAELASGEAWQEMRGGLT